MKSNAVERWNCVNVYRKPTDRWDRRRCNHLVGRAVSDFGADYLE